MASWKLIVEDYGMVKTAEIEIAPLTLFLGDNNSGKSYLLSLLWGIEKFGIAALIGEDYVNTKETAALIKWICAQIDIAIKKHHYEVSLEEISDTLERLLNAEIKKNKSSLVKRIFNSKDIDIGNLTIKLGDLSDSVLYLDYKEDSGLHFRVGHGTRFGLGLNVVTDRYYEEDELIQWFLIQELYSGLMEISDIEDDTDSRIYLPAARTGFMLTKDIINRTGRKNTFNLSEEKEVITPFLRPINQFLDILSDISAEIVADEDKLKLVREIEGEMTDGSIEVSAMPNKEVRYAPTGFQDAIPLRLSSAVVTELSPLILILKHKKNVKRLYYEEPEMCLHPQLQYNMGKIICRMVNSRIGMVITTHSDIIVQYINNMIKLAKREDCKDICEKLGYTKRDLLTGRQIKVYQLSANSGAKTEVKELLCGEDGFCVPTFNDALDSIMNESYEIQG